MSRYRRPRRHHTYDYNFKVGESSYQDMLAYLDKKEGLRAASPPPGRKSFAERFAERPIYGEPAPLARGGLSDSLTASAAARADTADLEAEEFIASLKRRPRPQQNGPSALAGEPGEDLGSRTRRALAQIDADFQAMGIFERPAAAASSALAVRAEGEEAAQLSAAEVSSARVSATVSSEKVAAAEQTSSARSKRRSVRYAD